MKKERTVRYKPFQYLYFAAGALLVFQVGKSCAAIGMDYPVHSGIAESLNLKDPLSVVREESDFIWHVTARLIAALLRRIGLAERYGNGIVTFSGQLGSGLFVAAGFLLTCYFLHRYVPRLKAFQVAALGLVIHLASSIYVPGFSLTPYRGQDSFNPWHNPTIIALRPFMILFMCLLCEKLLQAREIDFRRGLSSGNGVFLAFLLLLTNMAKPCFVQCFLPAFCLMMIIWLVRFHGRNFKFAIRLMFVCLPSAFYTLFQFVINFGEGADEGVEIRPFVVAAYSSKCIPLSIFLLQAFACVMWIILHTYEHRESAFRGDAQIKKAGMSSAATGDRVVVSYTGAAFNNKGKVSLLSTDAEHELSFLMWAIATAEKLLLAEKGAYLYNGNFTWAYSCASAWCFYVAVKDYAKLYLSSEHPVKRKSAGFIIASAVLMLHVCSGLYYIWYLVGMGHSM